MSEEMIRVRLVPKTRSGASMPEAMGIPMPQSLAKEMAPGEPAAMRAAQISMAMDLNPTVTSKRRVDLQIEQGRVEEVFQTVLTMKTASQDGEDGHVLMKNPDYFSPEKELTVPDSLRDEIDFAYVPTPVEYHSLHPVSPKASVYHLQLLEVVSGLNVGACHREGWTGKSIRLAMTDSGFSPHPFFERHGFRITRLTGDTAVDPSGHGTGESANALMVAPDADFIGIKTDVGAAQAIETALEQNPRIITNSWGWNVDFQTWTQLRQQNPNFANELRDVENLVHLAINDGVVVIFSAGNGQRSFPACIPSVIAAGGVTLEANGSIKASSYASSFRSRLYPGRTLPDFCGLVGESGSSPLKGHIMLPVPNGSQLEGENLPQMHSGKGWGVFSGTSAAAPQIAGVVALMLSANPDLTPSEVKSILASTCTDVTKGQSTHGDHAAAGVDRATGTGLVDARRACQLASSRAIAEDFT